MGDGMNVEPEQVVILVFMGGLYWGHRDYVTGWGGKYEEIRKRHGLPYMIFVARAGRTLLPGTWAVGGLLMVTVVSRLRPDSEILRVISVALAVLSFGLLIYAIKQFVKPGRNSRVPDWVREIEEPTT